LIWPDATQGCTVPARLRTPSDFLVLGCGTMTTTGFLKCCDGCGSRDFTIVRQVLLLSVITIFAMTGCAGWLPWGSSETTKKQAARYGQTADQRIAELKKEADEAREKDVAAQVAFTQGLIQSLLGEHDPRVRCSILEIAAAFETPAAAAICEGGLQDPDMRVRIKACDVCSQRGSQAVPLLAAALETDADVDVRLQAVRALGDTEDAAAIPVLARALEDPDPAIQYRAVAALKQVSGRDLGNDVNAWRTWAADPDARDAEPSMAEAFRRLF
jgi:HEAT repeat protein